VDQSGGIDVSGMILFGMFIAMLFYGFKKLKQLKKQEGTVKFKNSDFGDGFL
jgi:hypothetical protein